MVSMSEDDRGSTSGGLWLDWTGVLVPQSSSGTVAKEDEEPLLVPTINLNSF